MAPNSRNMSFCASAQRTRSARTQTRAYTPVKYVPQKNGKADLLLLLPHHGLAIERAHHHDTLIASRLESQALQLLLRWAFRHSVGAVEPARLVLQTGRARW